VKIGDRGIALLKRWEQGPRSGPALTAYLCPAGKWTIGYGHVLSNPGKILTDKAAAEDLLRADLSRFEAAVELAVFAPLDQHQFDALVCFAFNVGVKAFQDSTLVRRLNDGHYGDVPGQLRRWNKVDGAPCAGLANRREAEIELWSTP
jgi:lysozyme